MRNLRRRSTSDQKRTRQRSRLVWIAKIAAVRIATFLSGWILTVRYGDWRQIVGYPLIVVGALPDALFVRYIIRPRSPGWPIVMVISLMVSSAIVVAVSMRDGQVSRDQ